MIPPNASLVKYDNPVLVSRNTDKKTPRVSLKLLSSCMEIVYNFTFYLISVFYFFILIILKKKKNCEWFSEFIHSCVICITLGI